MPLHTWAGHQGGYAAAAMVTTSQDEDEDRNTLSLQQEMEQLGGPARSVGGGMEVIFLDPSDGEYDAGEIKVTPDNILSNDTEFLFST